MSLPLVSVIIITHNRASLLPNAIQSVLMQTYPNIEIIVVDDGSTDETKSVVLHYPAIRSIHLEKPMGANAARNRGILAANGYFVTGLDDDDTMMPSRIEKLVQAYDEKFAYTCAQMNYCYADKIERKKLKYFGSTISLNEMLYYNLTGNQVLSTKDRFLKAGLYDESLPAAQDYDMWLKLLLQQPIAKIVSEPLLNVDRNDRIGRISTSKKHLRGYFAVYRKYKSNMTADHRRFQIFKLRFLSNKPLKLSDFFRYFTYQHPLLFTYLYIKSIKKRLMHA